MKCTALAVLIASTFMHSALADGIGRLFFSPEQRAQLESKQARPVDRETPALTLNGVVQREGGSSTIWINGVAQIAEYTDHTTDTPQLATPGNIQPLEKNIGRRLLLERPPEK